MIRFTINKIRRRSRILIVTFAFIFIVVIIRSIKSISKYSTTTVTSTITRSTAKSTPPFQGYEEEIGGVKTYKIGHGNSVIIILTDIFGYSFVNTRKIADRFAAETGATVLIPDYFHGDPIDPKNPKYKNLVPRWLKKHPTTEASKITDRFILSIKDQYQSIHIVGFCYGGKVAVHLITHPELSSLIKSAVVGHPTFLVKEEAIQIKQPILFLCAETDQGFSTELQEHFEKELTENGLGIFLYYPGTVHGFIIRPGGAPQARQQSDKAIQDAIEYFIKDI